MAESKMKGFKGFNKDYINNMMTVLLKATEGGLDLNINDPEEIGQYVFSILAVAAEAIPVFGSAVSALTSLLGKVFFGGGGDSTEKIWEQLRERIEKLIGQKIAEHHVKVLKAKVQGLQDNMGAFSQYAKNFHDATAGDQKERAGRTLQMCHIAFLAVIRAAMPEFRIKEYMVPSLLLFAAVANIHLTLLNDGIAHGKDWGYSDNNTETMRAEFKRLVSPKDAPGMPGDKDTWLERRDSLKEAIKEGEEMGVPANVLDTWKTAYAELFESEPRGDDNEYGDLDYVTYAKEVVKLGRKDVKPEESSDSYGNEGTVFASKYRAYGDYDRCMILNVLNYAEIWPYMGDEDVEIPEATVRNLDREVFFGPYRRWMSPGKWTDSAMAPVVDRQERITSIRFSGASHVEGVQIKHGDTWGGIEGYLSGYPKDFDLAPDEWIKSVEVYSSSQVAQLTFLSNKEGRSVTNGNGKSDSDKYSLCSLPGYELTSFKVTRNLGGCLGVILGFRPLLTGETEQSEES